ncbi:MAG: D-lyxose/D-mannose family sugar isomerase [Spirochaetaceae bacterium]|nr:D-lyxose/D-mannose family sugar isomerase [Spirochaetaceae bacterium]
MKRSEINRYITTAMEFIRNQGFALPPFAFWSPQDWEQKGEEYREIRENQLGWDLTDFGSGDFEKIGLLLFTIRNGNVSPRNGLLAALQKTYAEKVMVVNPGQVTPYHYHKSKMEDIINRGGGGFLKVQVYGSLGERVLDEKSPVSVAVDGRNYSVESGSIISLAAGESITLFPGVFHQFWADGTTLLLGEVSMVNDDHRDNFFLNGQGRFPAIDEDEAPRFLLVGDYSRAS